MFGDYFVTYAVSGEDGKLDKQTEATLNKNVKFDAYFQDENGATHYKTADVNNDDVEIMLQLQVLREGYLKNANIYLKTDKEEIPLNYKLLSVTDEEKKVQSNTENSISLRQINKDEKVSLSLKIAPNIQEKTSKEILNQYSKILIKGTYMNDKGEEIPIEKDVTLNLAWTGKYEIENNLEVEKYIPLDIQGEKKVFIQYNLKTGITPGNSTNTENTEPVGANSVRPSNEDTLNEQNTVTFEATDSTRANIGNTAQNSTNTENTEPVGANSVRQSNEDMLNTKNNETQEQTNYILPIKSTEIELNLPTFNGIEPEKVEVTAKSTMATNALGEGRTKFTNENWTKSEKTVKINVENKEDEEGYINVGSGNDEYILTLVYPEEAYNTINNKTVNLDTNIKTKINMYTDEEIEKEETKSNKVKDTLGKLLSLNGKLKTEKIGKGKMYANINAIEKINETEYETSWHINVGYEQNVEQIRLEDGQDNVVTENGQEYEIGNYTQYKTTTINKESFLQVLGEDGSIQIKDNSGNILAIINKASKVDENGDFIVYYIVDVSQIKIETSKPVAEGTLIIENKKIIKGTLPYTKVAVESFSSLSTSQILSQRETDSKNFLQTEEAKIQIPFEESSTKATLSIDKESLSTLVLNKDVEFKIELLNNKDTSDLYMDPMFDIELPNYIEDIEIKEYKLLYEDELIIKSIDKLQNSNGGITLRIKLDGVQTKFSTGAITNGTNIILKTNIKLNILTPSKTDIIKMYYYNMNSRNLVNPVTTENGISGFTSANIAYSAPLGMLSVSNWKNFDDTGRFIMSVNQGQMVEQIETFKQSRASKMELIVVNNTGNTCEDMQVLVRIPFKGNKSILKGEDLGTTIDSKLLSNIEIPAQYIQNFKIYYSENGEATKDLSDSKNGWTEQVENFNKIKSCLIVGQNYQMNPGETVNFTYNIEVPENLTYNNNINSSFATYYTEISEGTSIKQETESDIIGITTGKGPELQITQEVTGQDEQGYIKERGILKYKVTVTNTGTESAKDVKITDQIPKWTEYVRSNSTLNTSYRNAEFYTGSGEKGQTMAEWNVIENATEEIGSSPKLQWNIEEIKPGETVIKEFEVATGFTPNIITYYSNYPGFTVDESGRAYIATKSYDASTDTIKEKKNELTNVPEIELNNIVTVTASNFNTELKAPEAKATLKKSDLFVTETRGDSSDVGTLGSQTQDDKDLASQEKEVIFTITVLNKSEEEKSNVTVEKILPEGLTYILGEVVIYNLETGEKDGKFAEYDSNTRKISTTIECLKPYKSFTLQVKAKTDKLEEGSFERYIYTNSKVSADGYQPVETNELTIKVVKPSLLVEQYCSNENKYLNEGEEIEYMLVVQNIGKAVARNVTVNQILQDGLKFVNGTKTVLNLESPVTENDLGGVTLYGLNIAEGESVVLKVWAKVEKLNEDTGISTMAEVSGDNIDYILTDPINQLIQKSENVVDEPAGSGNSNSVNNSGTKTNTNNINTTNQSKESGLKLSGTAWVDENENGQRDNTEKILENITVILIDTTTGNIAQNINGEDVKTTTNTSGNYTFTNLKQGNYIVEFIYDSKLYTVTSYQASNIGSLLNSDAIEREITQDGQTLLGGVSDTITLEKSISNIDIGLVERLKFDLSLNKTVKKVNVQNKEGVKTYTFEGSKLAQLPISARQLANSVVAIEYSIKVTNEGNLAGYAKSIVDYMPKEMTFNSELNTDWYSGSDGKLYTKALENIIINPGETKEVGLVLTKRTTEESTGIVNNNAEIKETFNEYGIKDKDSSPGNNIQNEDDQSGADVILTVRTGGQLVAVSIGLIIGLGIIGIIIYEIRMRKSKKE